MQKYFKQIFIFLVLGVALPQVIFAAEISIDAKTNTIAVSQQFEVTVILNTKGEEINAVEGRIIFPADLLELKEIRDANSIISFWVEKPKIESAGQLVVSGIIPGGYQGQKGLLLTLIFVSKKDGQGTIKLQDTKALLNDGNGTEAKLTTSPYKFSASRAASAPAVSSIKDKERPETFSPEVSRDPNLFENKRFVVFATQDKGSGIDHYEVKETRQKFLGIFSKWTTTESPYILQDQELRSYVFVKAVDKAGNARVEKIPPQNPLRWYENYENWIMIIVGLAIAYAIRKLLWRRNLVK